MSRYGHRFTRYGFDCPECAGSGENEGYFERLVERCGGLDYCGLTPYSLLCEICSGNGYLTGAQFKEYFGIMPRAAGAIMRIIEH